MSMPRDLVLVRHGQSEANVRQKASRRGDDSLFTEDLVTVPDRSWRLTELGAAQAQSAGRFLQDTFPKGFDRYIVSPFMRTRETAANLQLPGAEWEENRMIRERSWGEIDGLSVAKFQELYPLNARLKEIDPIYWAPPAGESLAAVLENRVSNFLRSLSRDSTGSRVLAVTHGDFILSTRMLIEQWSDEEFLEMDADEEQRIRNCISVRYSRQNPYTDKFEDEFHWVNMAYPGELIPGTDRHEIVDLGWREFGRAEKVSSEELLELVESQERRLTEVAELKAALPEAQ